MKRKRAETDKSLRTERDDTDRALRDRLAAERAADAVVDLARRTADALVLTARHEADHDISRSAAIERAVGKERAQADEVLQHERTTADDRLRRERDQVDHVLAELLPLEREHTDRDLLTERARSDETVASRDDFLGMVSHDLRNLLGGIVLCASSLSKSAAVTDEQKKVVVSAKRIQLYAARMNRLVCDLLDVVSIDAGKLPCLIVPSDPLALIAETLATFRRAASEEGIALESEVIGVLPPAAFDSGRMLQVFSNLVSNALKFTPRGGEICLRGERAGDEVHFSVSDTGRGIRDDLLHAVFLRFWQAGTDNRGSGLGLYISKSLVEAQRGRMWVESKVGEGSVFHFTVPVAALA